MKTLLLKKTVGFVAVVYLVACPVLSAVANELPGQSLGKKALPVASRQGESPVLARNTTRKPEVAATEASTKVQKVQDKKTIGRCWQRLMNMAREVRHAHRDRAKQ